jgi:signal transduction histidine kinase/CheY-like chemotaxis protein
VSAVGIPRLSTDPVRLDNARAWVTGTAPLPLAVLGSPKDAGAGKLDGQAARFTGRVVGAGVQGRWMTLTVEDEERTFTVVILDEVPAGAQVPTVPGSRVEASGVVSRLPLVGVTRTTFAVMCRSDGLTVLAVPPGPLEPPPPGGWTGRRVAYLLIGFCGLLMLGGVIVAALRVQGRRAARLASEEKEKLEGQLQVAARLEAVGRVAGGVAHDFNNILTVINGCAQLLDEEIAADPHHAVTLAADIRRAGRLAAALTRLLLAFSRSRSVALSALDLNTVVTDAEPVLARLLGTRGALRVRVAQHLPPVRAEVGMLLQVLINLAVNAGEAMPDGGTFTLTTSDPDPGWVRLTATDTGTGMTEAVRTRALERGFTTKPAGTGTGLSTVSDIVQALGGRLRFRSAVGAGTEFEIDLPVAGAPALPADEAACLSCERPTVDAQNGDTDVIPVVGPLLRTVRSAPPVVLVVDDDEAVRTLVRRTLERAGLRVFAAADPEQGLGLLAKFVGPLDLLITDAVMPGMDGRQLADRVRAGRPGVRVLLMSGYTADEVRGPHAPDEFLHKPFTPRELTERVWRTLERAAR